MIFNPQESIDFHGFTGPFVQYSYARIQSILRKEPVTNEPISYSALLPLETELLLSMEQFSSIIQQAAAEHNPSLVAIYVFNLAKTFNSFYTAHSIANAESAEKKQLRLQLASMVSHILKTGMGLLGIAVPERM